MPLPKETAMRTNLLRPFLLAFLLVLAALSSAPTGASQSDDVRYCCTPQQVRACSAQSGTTSCRPDNICRCFF